MAAQSINRLIRASSASPPTEITHHHFQREHYFYTIHMTRVESEMSIQHMLLTFPLLFTLIRTVEWESKIQCEMITNQSLSQFCKEQNELIKVSAKNHKVLAIMWPRITAYIVISHQVIQQWIDTPLSYLCSITKLNNAIPPVQLWEIQPPTSSPYDDSLGKRYEACVCCTVQLHSTKFHLFATDYSFNS
jgi:hypothetical protein